MSNDPQRTTPAESVPSEAAHSTQDEENTSRKTRQRKVQKIVVATIFIVFITIVIIDSFTTQYIKKGIDGILSWIESHPISGFFVSLVIYFVSTVLFIPVSVLTLGGGFIYAHTFGLGIGVLINVIAVWVGASCGAMVSFFLGRYLLRDWVKGIAEEYPKFEAIDSVLENRGFRIMALLHLSPVIPFNAMNYIAGSSATSAMTYFWSLAAILPGTIFYSCLGATAGSLADSGNKVKDFEIVAVVLGLILFMLCMFILSHYARLELSKIECREDTGVETNARNEEEFVQISSGLLS